MAINKKDFEYVLGTARGLGKKTADGFEAFDWLLENEAGRITLSFDAEFGMRDEEGNYWVIDEDRYILTITPKNGNEICIVKTFGNLLKVDANYWFASSQKDALLDWGVETLANLGGICKDFSL